MEKVIEILKKNSFEKQVMNAANIAKATGTYETDEQCLNKCGVLFIKYLVTEHKLTDDEKELIFDKCISSLIESVLKELNMTEIVKTDDKIAQIMSLLGELLAN